MMEQQGEEQAMDNTSVQLILDAINSTKMQITEIKTDLSKRIDDVAGQVNNLADAFLPRREAEAIFQALRDDIAKLTLRIVSQEEWRLAQTEKVADVQVMTENSIASDRKEQDARTLMFIWGMATLILGVLLSFVFTRLIH